MLGKDLLCCPVCRGEIDVTGTHRICARCARDYPLANGFPVLVRDPAALDADLSILREIKPDWYAAEQHSEIHSPWRHHLAKRRQYVERVLAAYLGRQGKSRAGTLLDLGCGDGANLDYLPRWADRVYATDYNAIRLARMQVRFPAVTGFLSNLMELPVVSDACDVVFFNHVLEHTINDEGALAEVLRILKPDGLLVLGVPNEGAWWWQRAYRRRPDILKASDHRHFYTASIIISKLIRQGFVIQECKELGWGPPDWDLNTRWRRHKWVDDLFSFVGCVLLRGQASSLYVVASKPGTKL